MARIAIVTGATGGIGREFISRINPVDDIDEIWAVGRNKDKLDRLCSDFDKVIPIEADLAGGGCEILLQMIEDAKPDIRMLINNAGTGFMGRYEDMTSGKIQDQLTVNCEVPALLINKAIPYMNKGARILNISSASSFQPNPYLSLYSAGKVFIKNLSRALNQELKDRGITVTAVCPGWVDTGMLPAAKDGKPIHYTGIITPQKAVDKALRDSSKGKDISTPGFFASYFRIYSKITPTGIVMRQWSGVIKKYI